MGNKNKDAKAPDTAPEKEKKTPEAEDAARADAKPEAEAKTPPADGAKKQPEEKAGKKEKSPSPEEQLKAEKDRYLRLLAEYDNFRKRSARERENIYADLRADTVTKFLPVFDNLERALSQPTQDEAYRKGVEMILTQFRDILKEFGVTEIEAVGKAFDPALHHAVLHEEDETKGEGEIVQELQKGFRMGDKVIRFSMVKTVN